MRPVGILMSRWLVVSAVSLTPAVQAGAYSGGSGTPTDPHQISTVADWQQLMATTSHWGGSFVLTANLDLAGVSLTPVGNKNARFKGVLDGAGYAIRNAVMRRSGEDYIGLFGQVDSTGRIRNLALLNVDTQGRYDVGGLAGSNGGRITGCSVTGTVRGEHAVGGLAGYNSGTITACHNTADVSGFYYIGGLAGQNHSGTIVFCHAAGALSGASYVGGIAGYNNLGAVTCCYATATVSGSSYAGGLVGYNSGSIDTCYAAGAVDRAVETVGGLVGWTVQPSVIDGCFWDVDASGQTSSGGGTGKTTAEMMTLATFTDAGWDFVETWRMSEGVEYPRFQPGVGTQRYGGGDGTAAAPYRIRHVIDWQELMDTPSDWMRHFVLTADLDLAGVRPTPVGDKVVRFTGVFDGAGHTIRNVSSLQGGYSEQKGLFGSIGIGGVVKNMALIDASMHGYGYVGGLAGSNSGTIIACCVTGQVSGLSYYIGGLVGYHSSGTISDCNVAVTVSGSEYVGGLAGRNSGTIIGCHSAGTVNATFDYAGGLTGYHSSGTISDCNAAVTVSGRGYVGGLVGWSGSAIAFCRATGTASGTGDFTGGLTGYHSSGTISDCNATGMANGIWFVGGLTGHNSGTITSCYATGAVEGGNYAGGLAGRNSATITSCYATGAVEGGDYAGGLAGSNAGTIAGCYAAGGARGNDDVGGLVGTSSSGVINRCFAAGSATGSNRIGGLTGQNTGAITSCYATGAVEGGDCVGGLAGSNTGVINCCYAIGPVQGNTRFGGLLGGNYYGSHDPWGADGVRGLAACFWDIRTSGQEGSYGGKGLTTAQMKDLSIYQNAGWGDKGWVMADGEDYPRLNWEHVVAPPIPLPQSLPLGGNGTADDPYLIATEEEFALLSRHAAALDKHFRLVADLDLAGVAVEPIGDLGPFVGVFDGRAHTISNASINRPQARFVGLFGYVGTGGQVGNVGLVDGNVQGGDCVGALAGFNNGGTITGCYATGVVAGAMYVGGLVGCEGSGLGGRTIRSCYATAAVTGEKYVGGLVGYNGGGTILSCYAAGPVSASEYAGGLAGYGGGTLTSCFWDIEASGQTSGAEGTGKSTAEMRMLRTFLDADWDFVGTWSIQEGIDYPRLQWRPPTGTYTGGSGTEADPYRIATTSDLQELMATPGDWDKHFVLTSHLDLTGVLAAPVGNNTAKFTGAFDGAGYAIRHAVIDRSKVVIDLQSRDYVGLFGYLGPAGRIENLHVVDVNVQGGERVGGLVGHNEGGAITACSVTGTVGGLGRYVGGLVGYSSGPITFCHAAGTVRAMGDYAGGLVGYNKSDTIDSCYAAGDVSGYGYVGGLNGYNDFGIIRLCYATGTVNAKSDSAGGLVGYNIGGVPHAPLAGGIEPAPWGDFGIITCCYAKGAVSGRGAVGGLVGSNTIGSISFCYAAGPVTATVGSIGGLVSGYWGTAASCFWDIEVTGCMSSSGGVGKTTAQMLMLSTFADAGWDFEETWAIVEGDTYPRLQWQSGGTYSGGSGTQADPFKIRTKADWRELTVTPGDWDACFVLLSHLDMSGRSLEPIGDTTSLFTGVFDGSGYTISNAVVGRADSDCVGLFGIVGFGGRIDNLGVVNADVQGRICVGALAGLNCQGTIRSCYTTGTVGGNLFVGGLVGYNWEGAITACHSTAATNGVLYVGGLAGRNSGSISFSYAAGLVNGSDCVGGLVGYTDTAPVAGSVESSFWDIEASGQASSAGGIGKTTAEMKMRSTFSDAGWDFADAWGMCEGTYYPRLGWQPWGTYSGGGGTQGEPYIIDTPADWHELMITSADWDKFFLLTSDLDLSGLALAPVGHGAIGFTGVFDGSSHRISSAVVNLPDSNYVGLFGYVGPGGRVEKLGLTDATIQGQDYVGVLVGCSHTSTISRCYATGNSSGNRYVGALAGWNYSGTITDCYATGAATGNSDVGGLAGWNHSGTITDCYATGAATGNSNVGGLVGWNYQGKVVHCYSIGRPTGIASVGGLCGGTDPGGAYEDTGNFWDTETSLTVDSAMGTGRTTAQMHRLATFTQSGWDFLETWRICEHLDYPRLQWEIPGPYAGGSGTEQDPYKIGAAADWWRFMATAADWNKHFILITDVYLAARPVTPVAQFTGVFDGRGFTIRGVVYDNPNSGQPVGLFSQIASEGRVENLAVVDVNFSGRQVVGGLAGHNSGAITSCYVTGSIKGRNYVGGLAGYNSGSIVSCRATADVSGGGIVGGLAGENHYGTIRSSHAVGTAMGTSSVGGLAGINTGPITFCSATGSVSATERRVGGLVGYNLYGEIISSYAMVSVATAGDDAGGLVGGNDGGVYDCCAMGPVSGGSDVGGLVGRNQVGAIRTCYAAGSVAGAYNLGGLVGYFQYRQSALIADATCFWDTETSQRMASAAGTGKTTAEMQMLSTFTAAEWDFAETWAICEGTNYPRLQWQIPAGDFLCPDGVSLEDMGYFAGRWLMEDCGLTGGCEGADLTGDGKVDMGDLAVLGQDWGRE